MRAVVQSMYSPDADVETWRPADPENFSLYVQLHVGAEGERGSELFALTVCTPRWLERYVHDRGPLHGRHHLIVERWDWDQIVGYVTPAVRRIRADTWDEVADRVARLACSEFDDGVP